MSTKRGTDMPAPTTTIAPEIAVFAPLGKVAEQPDGTILVDFVASTETPDDQGEVVSYEAVKKAAGDYMRWAAVREMHQPSAVGTTLSLETNDELRKVTGTAHIVDPTAIKKVLTGVYKGVSIGGRKLATTMAKVGGRNLRHVTDIAWVEISLADRPSNADTVLTLAKRSDAPDPAGPDAEEAEMAKGAATQAVATDAAAGEIDQPLEKAADTSEAPETAAAAVDDTVSVPDQTPATAPLAKSASDDSRDAAWILGDLNRLIEEEAKEGDTGGVGQLRSAQTALVAFLATESAEVGTPADVVEAEAEDAAVEPIPVVIVEPMYYSAIIGDLAKRAIAGPADDAKLDELVKTAIAAGGHCGHEAAASPNPDSETLAKIADATFAKVSDQLLEKVTRAIGAIARPDDLEAVKGEILGSLGPIKEALAKIASQPMPGGPLRYATDARRFDPNESSLGSNVEAETLAKAAMTATDPMVKEALGKLAAEAQLKDTLSRPSQVGR